MTAVLRAQGLGKSYGRRPALSDCTLDVPAGHVVGLVGPNGAGKSTLLNLAVGMLDADLGHDRGARRPTRRRARQLAKVGFVAQDTPTYAGLSVDDHLRLGAHLNPGWDAASRAAGSSGSASTSRRRRASSPAASAPSSRSPSGSPSAPSC